VLPFGAALRFWRKLRGFKQGALAQALGITQSTYSGWERQSEPPRNTLAVAQLAVLLGVEYEALKEGRIEMPAIAAIQVSEQDMIETIARQRGISPELLRDWIIALIVMPAETQEIEVEGARLKTRLWQKQHKRLNEANAEYNAEIEEG